MNESSIVRDGDTGEALVAGTDVTVSEILLELAMDDGIARVLDAFPDLSREDVVAAVQFAVNATRSETRYNPGGTASRVREARVAYGTQPATDDDALAAVESEYERVRYEFELISGIRNGLRELREGKEVPHEQVMAELRAILYE